MRERRVNGVYDALCTRQVASSPGWPTWRFRSDNFLQLRCERWQLSVASRCMLSPSMFRGASSKLSLRKKLTILASVGVLLPLLVLTYLQYRSLTELQNKTKGAFKDNLRQGLTIVEQLMKQRLEGIAVQTLNPISGIHFSSSGTSEELQKHFADVKRSHPEIDDIFVFGHSDDPAYATSGVQFVYENALIGQNFIDIDRKYLLAGRYLFFPLKNPTNNEPLGFAGVLLKDN